MLIKIRGFSRVVRGGSWINNADYYRVALRFDYSPGYRYFNLGFRVLRRCVYVNKN